MTVIVCASTNVGKVAELASLLDGVVEFLPRPVDLPDVIEDAASLEGNARLKATAVCRATGLPALADDTGLEVDALDGAPGVHTARFAGDRATDADNRALLLERLVAVESDRRTARFRTVILVRWPDGRELMAEGVCEGRIADVERGARGFGYDSLFIPDGCGDRTFAEMSDVEKNAVSHRGRAVRALASTIATVTTNPR